MNKVNQSLKLRRGASRSVRLESDVSPWLARVFAVFIALSGLVLMLVVVINLIQLPIVRVGVTGKLEYVTREKISELVAPYLNSGFVAVDLGGLRDALEDLPWISRVVLKREWPDGLNIEVHEQRAIAQWQQHSFVNHSGELFTPNKKVVIADLPKLSGPDSSQRKVMVNYRKMAQFLGQSDLKLLSLKIDDRGSWRCLITGNRELVLGRIDVIKRMQNFLLLYETFNERERQQFAQIDLRYTNGLSVAWNDKEKVRIAAR